MGEHMKSPKVRFLDNPKNWKEYKIGDLFTETKRSIILEDEQEYELVTVKRRNEGVVSRGHLRGENILVKNYFQVREGDFVVSKRQVVHGATGIIPKSLDKAIVSNEYLVSAGNEKISSEFWTLLSKLPNMHKKFFLSSYGVDIEKLVFDVDDWKKRNIYIPDPDEQKDLLNFFGLLKKQLKHHQLQYKKLINLKKAMLVKMFPKEGELIPEIRFKKFTKKWVPKKLNQISTYNSSSLTVSDALERGEFPLYDAKGVIGFTKNNIQPCDYIAIIKDGSGVGRVRLLPKNSSFIGTLGCIRTTTVDINFLYFSLLRTDFSKYVLGATIPHLYYSNYGESEYNLPEAEEQIMIGRYFNKLDSLINSSEIAIKKLSIIIKACQNKMFV